MGWRVMWACLAVNFGDGNYSPVCFGRNVQMYGGKAKPTNLADQIL